MLISRSLAPLGADSTHTTNSVNRSNIFFGRAYCLCSLRRLKESYDGCVPHLSKHPLPERARGICSCKEAPHPITVPLQIVPKLPTEIPLQFQNVLVRKSWARLRAKTALRDAPTIMKNLKHRLLLARWCRGGSGFLGAAITIRGSGGQSNQTCELVGARLRQGSALQNDAEGGVQSRCGQVSCQAAALTNRIRNRAISVTTLGAACLIKRGKRIKVF